MVCIHLKIQMAAFMSRQEIECRSAIRTAEACLHIMDKSFAVVESLLDPGDLILPS
jgi:hypothetical protein